MKRLGLIIIDDERSARELLRNLLKDVDWVDVLDEAESVEEAFPLIVKRDPDVILLDIQMPREDGFFLIELLMKNNIQTEVIFITAYEKYAIQAIKASAFDYLLKPVKKKELISSLERAMVKVSNVQVDEKFSRLIYQLSDYKKLKFKNRTGFSIIDANDILFCQADSNYSVLQMHSGKSLTVSMNLGKVEEMLPPEGFCRISRSLIVNIKYITQVERKSATCEVVGDSTHVLNISKKYMRLLEFSCERLLCNIV